MTIGFIIHRDAYYKYFGPIIDEALRRSHKVFCLHDYSQPRGGPKGYQFPALNKVPPFKSGSPEAISFAGNNKLLKIIKASNIQVIVTINLDKELKKEGVFWVAIQTLGDVVVQAESLGLPDRFFINSDAWLELSLAYLLDRAIIKEEDVPAKREALKNKVKSIGFPELDQVNLIDPASVRAEWGIPKEKPVVLFLPFPFHCSSDRFWAPFIYGLDNRFLQLPIALLSFKGRYIKQVWERWNDKKVVKAIKEFCQNNNAYLLVKARKKEPVRGYLARVADKVIYYDEAYYPATIIKCLRVADVCINFFSSTVLEGVPMGVPNICIAPSGRDYKNLKTLAGKIILTKQKRIYDFEGASYMLSIAESINLLPEKSLKDFPLKPDRQKEYIEKFVGDLDGNYSSKALDEIEKLVQGW